MMRVLPFLFIFLALGMGVSVDFYSKLDGEPVSTQAFVDYGKSWFGEEPAEPVTAELTAAEPKKMPSCALRGTSKFCSVSGE